MIFNSVLGQWLNVIYRPTMVINIGFKVYKCNGINVGLRIWDLGGQSFHRQIWRNYYKNTDGCLLIYDITRRYTFNDVVSWKNELNKFLRKPIPLILVGNKIDLKNERKISISEGIMLQNNIEAVAFYETSTLLNINIEKIFETLLVFL